LIFAMSSVLFFKSVKHRTHEAKNKLIFQFYGAANLFLIFYAFSATPHFFEHYLYLLLAGSICLLASSKLILEKNQDCGTSWPLLDQKTGDSGRTLLGSLAVISVFILVVNSGNSNISPSADLKEISSPNYDLLEIDITSTAQNETVQLSSLCPRNSSVFVWGWAAELYSYGDFQPSSRFVTFNWLILDVKERERYRKTFLDEFESHRPDCVVDATGDLAFAYHDSSWSIEPQFAAFKDRLSSEYFKTDVAQPSLVRTVYQRVTPAN